MGTEKSGEHDKLDSWKEIATYLNRDIRTCTRWEKKYGLPVRRNRKISKSGVIAYKSELDRWIAGSFVATSKEGARRSALLALQRTHILLISFLVLFLGSFLVFFARTRSLPANFRLEESKLVITSRSGKILWAYDTGISPLASERLYRERFQRKNMPANYDRYALPILAIKDINGNGRPETLFVPQKEISKGPDLLLCFDHQGKQLWRNQTGREIQFGKRIFSADFTIDGFDLSDLDNNGDLEVICISHAILEWPARLVVYKASGEQIGEYWNSGQFADLLCVDLNGDGKKKIIASGVNNEYARGFLVVLDPNNMKGASPQSKEEYICNELMRGTEIKYILLPRTDIDILKWPVDCAVNLELLKNGHIKIYANAGLVSYEFDSSLELLYITLGHGFIQLHNEYVLAGKIDSVLNESYMKRLREEVAYYINSSWVPADSKERVDLNDTLARSR